MTRNTIQKEIILSALCQMGNHPTAAMVYEEVHRTHPSISRSTVYRVLGQMAEDRAILHLGLAGSDARFDGNTFQHGHIRCRLCGCVADIPAVAIADPEDTAGFLLEDYAVEYRGLCSNCRESAKESV